MARALRLQWPGGRYHVTARGNDRGEIFWDDTDRFRFLELLGEVGQRFGTAVHAYVLMDNHYQAKRESWNQFVERHGDWGRDAALWLGRRAGRLRLAQLGRLVGNLDYAVVSKTIARFERRMRSDSQLRDQLAKVQLHLSK